MVQADIRWLGGKRFSNRTWLAVDPAGVYYAVFDETECVRIFRVSDHKEAATLPTAKARVSGLWYFSPNGTKLAVAYADKQTRIWDWQTTACLLEMPSPIGMDFSPDGEHLAVSVPGQIRVFDLSGR